MTKTYKSRSNYYDLIIDKNCNGVRTAAYIHNRGFVIEQFGPLDEVKISQIYISRKRFEDMIALYRIKFVNEEERQRDEYYTNSDTSITAKLRENLLLRCTFDGMSMVEIYNGLEYGKLRLIKGTKK